MKHFLVAAAVLAAAAAAVFAGCAAGNRMSDGTGAGNSFRQITQEEAKAMMLRDDGHIILDVRRADEYEAGHIPGAICLPNEEIGAEPPGLLPDKEQIILVYCRSGRRSKEAAQKLFDMGYTAVFEFGGIKDWTGDTVSGQEPGEVT